MKFTVNEYKFTIIYDENSIDIIVIDADMIKYKTTLNDTKSFNIIYINSLKIIYDIICESLKIASDNKGDDDEGDEKKISLFIDKTDGELKLCIIHDTGFFKIPINVVIPMETESDNIILERKIRKIEIDKNTEIKEMREEFSREINLLKIQLGGVIFLTTCSTPIPLDITDLVLTGQTLKSPNAIKYRPLIDTTVKWHASYNNGTDHLNLLKKLDVTFSNINGCGSCNGAKNSGNFYCQCTPGQIGKHILFISTMIAQKFEKHIQKEMENLYANAPDYLVTSYIFTGYDITSLSLLSNLTALYINYNDSIQDISPIKNLKLTELALINCISLINIDAIKYLILLTHVSLHGCTMINDGSSMENLENLIKVDIKDTSIKKLKLISMAEIVK